MSNQVKPMTDEVQRTTDEKWMQRAIDLAEKGKGLVHPNPMVGAVLVKDEQIIGQGHHPYYGGPHGEVMALRDCEQRGNNPFGATVYVTLEPCCHFGKTPPCTEALIQAGVSRVVVAVKDPNPLVGGKGIKRLREAGIQVDVGTLRENCLEQNAIFFHFIQHQRPYVILKSASSLDGKIATKKGDSQWITSETSRRHAHGVRSQMGAIMVGIGTVLADDPLLTCRVENQGEDSSLQTPPYEKRSLIRMVVDSQLQIPLDSKLVKSAKEVPLWIVCGQGVKPKIQSELKKLGAVLLEQPLDDLGHVDLSNLMSVLGSHRIDSLLIEGGGSLNDSALRRGIVNEVNFYIAPLIIGGAGAKTGVAGLGIEMLSEATELENMEIIPLGRDFLIKGKVRKAGDYVHGNC